MRFCSIVCYYVFRVTPAIDSLRSGDDLAVKFNSTKLKKLLLFFLSYLYATHIILARSDQLAGCKEHSAVVFRFYFDDSVEL